MNLILLKDIKNNQKNVKIEGKPFLHIKKVLKSKVGDKIKIGKINSLLGAGLITKIEDKYLEIDIKLNEKPPKKLPIILIMAMVRPKSLKKALHIAISMGVKEIYIIKTWKVEKSFWSSPILNKLDEIAIEALEQAKDTIMPKIIIKKRFKPFLEDELTNIIKDKKAILAEPTSIQNIEQFKNNSNSEVVLAVGPEGGFIEYEINKFKEIGFKDFNIGKRILRVEFAIPVLLGKIDILNKI